MTIITKNITTVQPNQLWGHADDSSKCLKFGYSHTEPELFRAVVFNVCQPANDFQRFSSGRFALLLSTFFSIRLVFVLFFVRCFQFTVFFSLTLNIIQNLFCIGGASLRYQMRKNSLFFSLLFLPVLFVCICLQKESYPLWRTCTISCLSLPNPQVSVLVGIKNRFLLISLKIVSLLALTILFSQENKLFVLLNILPHFSFSVRINSSRFIT